MTAENYYHGDGYDNGYDPGFSRLRKSEQTAAGYQRHPRYLVGQSVEPPSRPDVHHGFYRDAGEHVEHSDDQHEDHRA